MHATAMTSDKAAERLRKNDDLELKLRMGGSKSTQLGQEKHLSLSGTQNRRSTRLEVDVQGRVSARRFLLVMAHSLASFFVENFRKHGRDCAYRQRRGYRTESFTYRTVLEMAAGFAYQLEARGIVKGDRVLLWGRNCAEWVSVFFGCAMRGVVIVPMDDGASTDFAARVAQQVAAKLVVASGEHLKECAALDGRRFHLWRSKISRRASRNLRNFLPSQLSNDDILQIVFTSGTTADPKGVVISHGNVLSNMTPSGAGDPPIRKVRATSFILCGS